MALVGLSQGGLAYVKKSTISASATIGATRLYYSGRTNNYNHAVFTGVRLEANIGAGYKGITGGLTAVYSPPNSLGNFVLGIGAYIGFGVSPTIIDVNVNYGETKRMYPWRNY